MRTATRADTRALGSRSLSATRAVITRVTVIVIVVVKTLAAAPSCQHGQTHLQLNNLNLFQR
jgi:fumarate reductase subunit D